MARSSRSAAQPTFRTIRPCAMFIWGLRPMLKIRDLFSFYGDSQVLHGISLSVADRERVAILGRNGAGKTTLFKSIMHAGPSIRGKIAIDGKVVDDLGSYQRARLGVSFVPEDRRIFAHLTVTENL